jgi:hypothetical protein
VDEKTAAHCVMDAYNPPVDLLEKAHEMVMRRAPRRTVRVAVRERNGNES